MKKLTHDEFDKMVLAAIEESERQQRGPDGRSILQKLLAGGNGKQPQQPAPEMMNRMMREGRTPPPESPNAA